MKYIFITYNGYSLPIVKQLQDEGNQIIVGQIQNAEDLGIVGWQGTKEIDEAKNRRLSLYDGIIKKHPADEILQIMAKISNKNDYFVVVDHNNLYNYGEKILKMGFENGLIPNKEDFDREKDRKSAQQFVKNNYKVLKILESQDFKNVADGIKYVNDSKDLLVLKSNGNFAETIIPKIKDVELNKLQIISALNKDKKDYEKGGFLLEKKILNPIEFTPELVFWQGEPIYSQVEIECKPIGAGDIGSDGGGAINLVIATNLNDTINKLAFPPAIYEMAKKRKGLFLMDAGILYDPETKNYYFTEFAGNRWSWGGVFSELSLSKKEDKIASNYFESVVKKQNPFQYRFGATISFYNLLDDDKTPDLHQQDIPIFWKKEIEKNLYLYQIRKQDEQIVNVGYSDILLGYAGGYGNSINETAKKVYNAIENVSFKEVLYRHKLDFLSERYGSSITNRFNFLEEKGLITEFSSQKNQYDEQSKELKKDYESKLSELEKKHQGELTKLKKTIKDIVYET